MSSGDPQWLEWAKRLQAAGQNGLTYAQNPFDRERYQSICDIAADIMAAYSDTELTAIADLFSREVGHATPKVDVRGAVFRGDDILLVQERSDGHWSLPGGWADVYDSPSEATVREVWEESGYRTRAVKLLAVYDRAKHPHPPMPYHAYKLFFLCELLGGSPAGSMETEGVAFFAETDLPELSLGRTTPGQIARVFEHHRHPEWPADFD